MSISREQIVSDFKENLDFLLRKKVSTNLIFHHRRAGVVGPLAFLADLADQDGVHDLVEQNLYRQYQMAKDQIEKQFEAAWVNAGRDVTRMGLRYLRDIAIGYNAAHDAYKDQCKGATIPPQDALVRPHLEKTERRHQQDHREAG